MKSEEMSCCMCVLVRVYACMYVRICAYVLKIHMCGISTLITLASIVAAEQLQQQQ